MRFSVHAWRRERRRRGKSALAATLTYLKSAPAGLFDRLCQFCAVKQPNHAVPTALEFGSPLHIAAADCGGAIREDSSYLLDGPAVR